MSQVLAEQILASLLRSPDGNKQHERGQTLSPEEAGQLGTNEEWRLSGQRVSRAMAGERIMSIELALETVGLAYWANPELRAAVRTGVGLNKFLSD